MHTREIRELLKNLQQVEAMVDFNRLLAKNLLTRIIIDLQSEAKRSEGQ